MEYPYERTTGGAFKKLSLQICELNKSLRTNANEITKAKLFFINLNKDLFASINFCSVLHFTECLFLKQNLFKIIFDLIKIIYTVLCLHVIHLVRFSLMSYAEKLSTWKCVDPRTTCDLSGWALVEYVIFCHVMWWIFYYFLLLITKQSEEWCCRFLTLFHGCLISYSALKDAYVNKSPIDFQTTPLSEAKKHYLSYMVSYFLFDFCWIHFFGNETWVIYLHHIASIVIIINLLTKNYGGAGVAYGAAGLELTNPCLQLRWFLRTHGYYNKPIHKITELFFIISFFAIRMIGGTILAYYAIVLSDTDFVTKFSFVSIYCISLVLLWQILVFIKKKYLIFGHQANIYLIQSRMSISPYFQRRTFDRYENRNTENDEYNEVEELPTPDLNKKSRIPR